MACIMVLFLCGNDRVFGLVDLANVNYDIIDFSTSNFTISMSLDEWKSVRNNIVVEEVSSSLICDRDVIEYYSPMINDYVIVNGRKVNLQVSIFDGECIVGSPLIEKSF